MRTTLLVLGLAALSTACATSPEQDTPSLGVVESPLLTNVVEAESATGGGVVESDPTASNGQLRAFNASGTWASSSFTTSGTLLSAKVRVRGALCGPVLGVFLDGISVGGGTITSTAWTDLNLTVPPLGAGQHTVVFYTRVASSLCVLRIDDATFTTADPPPPPLPLITVEAESASGAGTNQNDGTASNGQFRSLTTPYSQATATFTSVGSLNSGRVYVRNPGCLFSPYLSVSVDGQPSTTVFATSATWQPLPFSFPTQPPGSHNIVFQYRRGDGCPLEIDRATLNQF